MTKHTVLEYELLGKFIVEFDLNETKEWEEQTFTEHFSYIMACVKYL